MICANPLCNRPQATCEMGINLSSKYNLCSECRAIASRRGLPIAGFIPSPALTLVARKVLNKFQPTKSEIGEAVRFARGTRHRVGDWNERPIYRITPLKGGRAKARLPHILVGRRYAPTELSITRSVVHAILSKEFIGTGHCYNRFLAGATYMGRQGLAFPIGKKLDVPLGNSRSSKWTMTPADLRLVGTHVLKAGKKLGLGFKDFDLAAFSCVAYQRAIEAGEANPPVVVPKFSMRTNFLGDSVFDHKFAPKAKVPARYRGKIRRASGLIDGSWPVGIEPSLTQAPAKTKQAPASTPKTDWIFEDE